MKIFRIFIFVIILIDISVLIILQFLWSGDFEYNKHSHLSNFGQYTSGTIGLIITGRNMRE